MLNDGSEIPKYYAQNSHPAIVSAEVFDLTQMELEWRRSMKGSCSGERCFASRIEADGSCTRLAALAEGSPANGFACSAASDTLNFQRNAAVCAASRFDVEHAVSAALTCDREGKGLLIGESSYARVGGQAEAYRLEP